MAEQPLTTTVTETPTSSDAFVDSAGLDTHFLYFSTPYVTQYSTVFNLLTGLGVRHIRDSLDDHNWGPYVTHLEQIAAKGIHLDANSVITDTTSSIHAMIAKMPTVIESFEGPNEYDLTGPPNWASQLRSFQAVLYAAVKSAPNGHSYPVWGPSITKYDDSEALGNLSENLDYGAMHNYFGAQNPGTVGGTPFPVGKYNSEQFWIGTGHLISGSKPLVTTETGYEDAPPIANSITASVKARYTMREFLIQWNAGITRTYFYELVDEGGQALGFVTADLKPKPVYTAVKNMLEKLSDAGPSFTLKPLSYSITAASTVDHTLLQKRDGSYRLMVWNEVPAADPAVATQTIVLKPSLHFGVVTQYIWQDDGTFKTVPLKQQSSGTITFTVTDRVSEIKLQQ